MSASRQRFRTSSGIFVSVSDSVIDVLERLSFLRELLVGVAAPRRQALEGVGLLERRQVLPLEVLDERQLDDLGVVGVAEDDRQLAEPGLNGRLVPPLPGDDLIAVATLADDAAVRGCPSRRSTRSARRGRPSSAGAASGSDRSARSAPGGRSARRPTPPAPPRSARRDASARFPASLA